MGINTAAKGRASKREVKTFLTERGWSVRNVEKNTRHVPIEECVFTGEKKEERDLFGVYDQIAVHPDHPTAYIQVKTNNKCSKKEYAQFKAMFPHNLVLQAVVHRGRGVTRKGVVLYWYNADGSYVREDYRS
jgi:RecB family exonuclease